MILCCRFPLSDVMSSGSAELCVFYQVVWDITQDSSPLYTPAAPPRPPPPCYLHPMSSLLLVNMSQRGQECPATHQKAKDSSRSYPVCVCADVAVFTLRSYICIYLARCIYRFKKCVNSKKDDLIDHFPCSSMRRSGIIVKGTGGV